MKASTDDGGPRDDVKRMPRSSPWAPFRSPEFARMASAQFVSNVGGWMQTVGAQELMLTLTTSATLVALIQTAAGLPVVLLAVPAGAIGDLVDRRRLLIAVAVVHAARGPALGRPGIRWAGDAVGPARADLRRRRRADADLPHLADAAARARRAAKTEPRRSRSAPSTRTSAERSARRSGVRCMRRVAPRRCSWSTR